MDCGTPDQPDDATVRQSVDTTFKSIALYDCEIGYSLVGPEIRSCLESGSWSENVPYCQRKHLILK